MRLATPSPSLKTFSQMSALWTYGPRRGAGSGGIAVSSDLIGKEHVLVNLTWPHATSEPYEINIETASGDTSVDLKTNKTEFDRFANLTRTLVNVSKSELDGKRKKS